MSENRESDTASEGNKAAETADEPIVAARMAGLTARWGKRLDEAGRAAVEARVRRHVQLARELRRVPFANGDEPEIVFVPFRADEGPGR
jgi:hypothetical protein